MVDFVETEKTKKKKRFLEFTFKQGMIDKKTHDRREVQILFEEIYQIINDKGKIK